MVQKYNFCSCLYYQVQYVDYGLVENIPVVHVYPILLCDDVPQLCMTCQLLGIHPVRKRLCLSLHPPCIFFFFFKEKKKTADVMFIPEKQQKKITSSIKPLIVSKMTA